jgi:hypothetical protein
MDEVDFVLQRFDPGLRLLLEGMDHPHIGAELHGVHHAERTLRKASASSSTPEPKPVSGLAIGGMPPSATTVRASSRRSLALSGKSSKSPRAAFIQTMGRVFLIRATWWQICHQLSSSSMSDGDNDRAAVKPLGGIGAGQPVLIFLSHRWGAVHPFFAVFAVFCSEISAIAHTSFPYPAPAIGVPRGENKTRTLWQFYCC